MTDRPPLHSNISAEDFQAFYWLKEELMGFCRGYGLPTSGSKQVLTKRIVSFPDHRQRACAKAGRQTAQQ